MSPRNARNAAPLDAVDLEFVRLYLEALEGDLETLQGRLKVIRRTIEEIQGRNPPRPAAPSVNESGSVGPGEAST